MDSIIKSSIESRKNAIFATYDVKSPGNLKDIEDFFKRVEDFAKDCKDVTDFETKFAASPLAQEYSSLFVQIMQTESTTDGTPPTPNNEVDYTFHDELKDDVERRVRRKARQEAYDKVRDVPVIGEAMTAKQHFDFFSRFRKK